MSHSLEKSTTYFFLLYARSNYTSFIGTKSTLSFQLNYYSGYISEWIHCSVQGSLIFTMQIVPPILPTLEITWLQTDASACARKFISRENNMGGKNHALRANWSDELRENVSLCNPILVSWSTFNYVHWDENSFHSLGFLMWPLSLLQRYFSLVSAYYLATISYTSRNKEKYIHKLIEAARRAIRNHKAYRRWTS